VRAPEILPRKGNALLRMRQPTAVAGKVDAAKNESRMEIAREGRSAFFPQRCVLVPGLDFGALPHSNGWGGRLLRIVIGLPDGMRGMLLADVSGNGIAAALMMASLQSVVRAEVPRRHCHWRMIGRLNPMLYDSSAEDRYAHFLRPIRSCLSPIKGVKDGHNRRWFSALTRECLDSSDGHDGLLERLIRRVGQ